VVGWTATVVAGTGVSLGTAVGVLADVGVAVGSGVNEGTGLGVTEAVGPGVAEGSAVGVSLARTASPTSRGVDEMATVRVEEALFSSGAGDG
jgi:hypothetical protein